MLSLFPTFLSWQLLSPFLIRLTLGAILIHWSYKRLTKKDGTKNKVVGIIDSLLGVLFVAGIFTQLAALILVIDIVIRVVKKATKREFLTDGVNYYLIILVLAISLLVTGAGWLAFDLSI